MALQQEPFQELAPSVLQTRLRIYVQFLRRTCAEKLRTIAATQSLTDSDIAALSRACHALCQQFEWG